MWNLQLPNYSKLTLIENSVLTIHAESKRGYDKEEKKVKKSVSDNTCFDSKCAFFMFKLNAENWSLFLHAILVYQYQRSE